MPETTMPETVVDEPGIADSPIASIDPKDAARAMAVEAAEDENGVGEFVKAIDAGDGITDYRFVSLMRGYEGWQWSVTMFHDVERDTWTVNESTLIPMEQALRPPEWIPWKDRLLPTDLSVTDSIGTDPDDPRLEEGFRATAEAETGDTRVSDARDVEAAGAPGKVDAADEASDTGASDSEAPDSEPVESQDAQPTTAAEDVDDAVSAFDLSRRHVLSPLGRAQTAQRWYEGPRGPKSLSTKTASGNLCSTCGFFVALQGDLSEMFGVCANKWSPDDGKVVSLDHGCGEHSEIEPPEPSHLWVQSKPAFDDLHIDIIAQAPRDERGSVELIEQLSANEDGNPNDEEEASEADIEANTVDDDANQEEVLEHTAQQDEPEVESTVDLSDDEEPVIVESEEDEATDAEPTEAEETDTAEENAPEAE